MASTGQLNETFENMHLSSIRDYFREEKQTGDINFARLEKGLQVFIFIFESIKETCSNEAVLWNHKVCFHLISKGRCSKTKGECHFNHDSSFRQLNLCRTWYCLNNCPNGRKCQYEHTIIHAEKILTYLRTETDAHVYALIRFVRNFCAHYLDTPINKKWRTILYQYVIVVMATLVHRFSPQRTNSIEHLNLFLEKTTINYLVEHEQLLLLFTKPISVPNIFLNSYVSFKESWFDPTSKHESVFFEKVSTSFIELVKQEFLDYFLGRLKGRGAKAAWD